MIVEWDKMLSRIVWRYCTTVAIPGIIISLVWYMYMISSYPLFTASRLHPVRNRTTSSQLEPTLTSKLTLNGQATVFYVWCGSRRRPFEFHNYLSVRSAVRILQPDNVWFYYESEPVIDDRWYNTWWLDLIDDVPFFHRRNLKDVGGQLPRIACVGPGRPSLDFIYALVSSRGGTFVDESTVLVTRPRDDGVTVPLDIRNQSEVRIRLLKADRGISFSVASINGTLERSPPEVRIFNCSSNSELIDANSAICVHVAKSLYPKDIWTLDSDVSRILRYEFYGRWDVIKPIPSFDSLAPNIGHMIWIGGGQMDFMFFLSVLSLLHVAKVDVVYMHGDKPPRGKYWNLLIDNGHNVKFVLRENAGEVFGQSVKRMTSLSNTWRPDILFKYGGVYADTDVIFLQPLSKELRAYDVVLSYEWPDWHRPFPDAINNGVAVSKPGARFMELWMKSMKTFHIEDWGWNGLRLPYRVLERHPDLAFIEPHLQVQCYEGLCHPTWWKNYHNVRVNHLSPPKGERPLDWRSDTFAFHFTGESIPAALQNPQALLKGDDMFAKMGRMVLEAADMVKHFQ